MAYIPENSTSGHLVVSDAEIEETVDGNPPAHFGGVNVFGLSVPDKPPTLDFTADTRSFSNEPVGVAYNLATQVTYYVDDNPDRVFAVTQSGNVTELFSTRSFNSEDPEGLEYLGGYLYIADGINREIYKVTLSGQLVTSFDTSGYASDPSGVGSDPNKQTLLIVGGNNNPDDLFELNKDTGARIETYDISSANGRRLDAVVMAPSSEDPTKLGYYIADRKQDNNANRLENDGAIYELAPAGPPPPPPSSTGEKILVSSTSGGTAGGIKFADEDVLLYDVDTNSWSLFFDGYDNGLSSFEIDSFHVLD
jgi:hypothetical protein